MNFQDPKFDLIFGNSISEFCSQLQERFTKNLSITESVASLTIKQIEQNSAMNKVNETAFSMASISQPIYKLLVEQQTWNDKFNHVFSPAWRQIEMFSKFREQTAHIGKILNPSIADFIQSNVRTSYVGVESVSAVEATYLEAFEQFEDEIEMEILEEITVEIQSNPEWREELKTLFNAFYEAHLRTEFTDAITEVVSRRLNIKNPKMVAAVIAIIIILFTIGGALPKDKQK